MQKIKTKESDYIFCCQHYDTLVLFTTSDLLEFSPDRFTIRVHGEGRATFDGVAEAKQADEEGEVGESGWI